MFSTFQAEIADRVIIYQVKCKNTKPTNSKPTNFHIAGKQGNQHIMIQGKLRSNKSWSKHAKRSSNPDAGQGKRSAIHEHYV